MLSALGFILFENSFGFYLAARSRYSARESLRTVLRLPSLYATLLAVALNFAYLYPVLTGSPIPESAWLARMWLSTWV